MLPDDVGEEKKNIILKDDPRKDEYQLKETTNNVSKYNKISKIAGTRNKTLFFSWRVTDSVVRKICDSDLQR